MPEPIHFLRIQPNHGRPETKNLKAQKTRAQHAQKGRSGRAAALPALPVAKAPAPRMR
jgi:hypothetical protein